MPQELPRLLAQRAKNTHEEATRVLVMRPALALQFRIYLAVSLIQMKFFGLRLHSWNMISLNMG